VCEVNFRTTFRESLWFPSLLRCSFTLWLMTSQNGTHSGSRNVVGKFTLHTVQNPQNQKSRLENVYNPSCATYTGSNREFNNSVTMGFQKLRRDLFNAILGAFAKLRKATVSFVMSVRPSVCHSAWDNSAPIGRTFMKLDIWGFLENQSRKFKFR
jgi:hypothetical protein